MSSSPSSPLLISLGILPPASSPGNSSNYSSSSSQYSHTRMSNYTTTTPTPPSNSSNNFCKTDSVSSRTSPEIPGSLTLLLKGWGVVLTRQIFKRLSWLNQCSKVLKTSWHFLGTPSKKKRDIEWHCHSCLGHPPTLANSDILREW